MREREGGETISDRAARVEFVEAHAEQDARLSRGYQVERAIEEARRRFPATTVEGEERELLSLKYWQHYAAAIADPGEATDATIRRRRWGES